MPYGVPPGLRTFATENTAGPSTAGQNANGNRNVFLGFRAGEDAGDAGVPVLADDVVAIGVDAGSDYQADAGIVIGTRAGRFVPDGANGVIAIGVDALSAVLDPTDAARMVGIIAIGQEALASLEEVSSSDGLGNIFIGHQAGTNILNLDNQSESNVVIGFHALLDPGGTAFDRIAGNVFIGAEAGENMGTNTADNTAVGRRALRGAAAGAPGILQNVAMGAEALAAATSANNNVAVGFQAGTDLTSGIRNTLVGHTAGQNLATGDENVMLGMNAAQLVTSGDDNVVIGYISGDGLGGTASNNVVVGQFAGDQASIGDFNIILGRGAGMAGMVTRSSEFIVETRAAGAVGAGTPADSLIYGLMTVGSVVIGQANDGNGSPINRDVDAANATNVLKILDGAALVNPLTGGVALQSQTGVLNILTSAGQLVVLGTAPSVTGAKGGNAALTSLCAQLANIGIITDNTT